MTKKLTQQDIRSIVSEVVASRKTISEQDEAIQKNLRQYQ